MSRYNWTGPMIGTKRRNIEPVAQWLHCEGCERDKKQPRAKPVWWCCWVGDVSRVKGGLICAVV